MTPRPCSADEAVARAISLINNGGQYVLGAGDYRPKQMPGGIIDLPWTERDGLVGSDCAGFAISWCYKLQRHRPGYNVGAWSTCSDDINCNSAIEDAQHARDCFVLVEQQPEAEPQVGDLLAYPTIYLAGKEFPGHVCIVVGIDRYLADPYVWDFAKPRYDLLDVAQCHGPNTFKPGVVRTDGSIWMRHDSVWPKPEHRSWLIRAAP